MNKNERYGREKKEEEKKEEEKRRRRGGGEEEERRRIWLNISGQHVKNKGFGQKLRIWHLPFWKTELFVTGVVSFRVTEGGEKR
jgi:hypothetical protein